eukprot:TRINITY_DN19959_c0_g1_i1.p1 TRINITY_DN19959_c0_g1~~TRINITY_DN19959_c0_g1_i1.p1  ORF type:complete len:264 (+),score=84.70 TRINITY_DN19959_c0_g1_i1:76-792(+)
MAELCIKEATDSLRIGEKTWLKKKPTRAKARMSARFVISDDGSSSEGPSDELLENRQRVKRRSSVAASLFSRKDVLQAAAGFLHNKKARKPQQSELQVQEKMYLKDMQRLTATARAMIADANAEQMAFKEAAGALRAQLNKVKRQSRVAVIAFMTESPEEAELMKTNAAMERKIRKLGDDLKDAFERRDELLAKLNYTTGGSTILPKEKSSAKIRLRDSDDDDRDDDEDDDGDDDDNE